MDHPQNMNIAQHEYCSVCVTKQTFANTEANFIKHTNYLFIYLFI